MFKFLKKKTPDEAANGESPANGLPEQQPDHPSEPQSQPDQTTQPAEQTPEHTLEQQQRADASTNAGPPERAIAADAKPEAGPNAGAANESDPKPEALAGKLKKSRGGFGDRLKSLFGLSKKIDDDLLEDIETLLLTADVGADASLAISAALSKRVTRKELGDTEAVWQALRSELLELIKPVEAPLQIDTTKQPFVILVVGVNGVGKTTTIGKLARRFKADGKQVMLAAGDTFRAAAVEQLQTWGQRNDVPVVAQATGADSASVIFDALESAKAKGIDVLIADTAGRLHTQANLMDELAKIKRVMAKLDQQAPHEVMIVIDGGTGQNALSQAEQFHQTIGLTGLTVTKLDGTAKGGVLFALAKKLAVPIRFIGVGESAIDLREFEAEEFVDALIGRL